MGDNLWIKDGDMMVIAIQKVTATEALVASIKERIRTGEFGPGDQLPSEQFMLKEYGVSRLTLREALSRLVALGIIRVQHGKGAFVKSSISVPALDDVLIPMFAQYDLKRMNDLVEARNLLESEMAAKVAKTRSAEDIVRLEELLQPDDRVIEDAEYFAERDYAFHLQLAEIAGNQFFLAMYQALHGQIRAFLLQYARSIEDRREALERHRPILAAIIANDIDNARSLALEHAGICASYVEKTIRYRGD